MPHHTSKELLNLHLNGSMTRPEDIKRQYIACIDKHLDDLVSNKADIMLDVEDFAAILFICPTHLSNTIKQTTGTSPCGILQVKILEKALQMLENRSLAIREIAFQLTYNPSQFTKWFKRLTRLTPKQYRVSLLEKGKITTHSEIMTILKSHADLPLYPEF